MVLYKAGHYYINPNYLNDMTSTPEQMKEKEIRSNEGMKFDDGKVDWSLLPTEATEEILKVFAFGAKKYERFNFRKGFKQSRLLAAAFRHIVAHMQGKDIDEESGLRHLAHAGCCVMMLLTNIIEGRSDDDRYLGN
jgi:hypothetical protein